MSGKPDGEKYQVTRGDRMKAYEIPWKQIIPAKSYTIIRVDGRAFHTFTRGMKRPFDADLMQRMDLAAVALCQQAQGAQFAYVQSDEISVLLTDFGVFQEPWFGGGVQKIASISASIATATFNDVDDPKFNSRGLAQFDARVFTVPERDEAINYFLWRQRDCYVNYISMISECHFSSKQLMHEGVMKRIEMLEGAGVGLHAYPDGAQMGRVVTREASMAEISFFHHKEQVQKTALVQRHTWMAHTAPWFDWDEAGFLMDHVPELPKEDANET